jgi:hypothetical protein
MLVKKNGLAVIASTPISPARYRLELERLYQRRMAIATLIDSLEQYHHSQGKRDEKRNRKTA